jgi:ABC-2 type transport system ATP-binding protein
VIEFIGITKYYGDNRVLNDLSFRLDHPGVVGLLGQNGAGKSTLMNMMTGYLSPSEGSVLVDGVSIFEKPRICKKKIGYLPEKPPLYGDLSVMQYLSFIFDVKKCRLDKSAHLRDVCSKAGISDVRNRIIKNLSKGYHQRIGLAQALVGNPPHIVFDEPSIGLDPVQGKELRQLIRELGKTRIVLVSSHLLAEIQEICDEVIILHEGRIAAMGPASEIADRLAMVQRIIVGIKGDSDGAAACLTKIGTVVNVQELPCPSDGERQFIVEYRSDTDIRPLIVQCLTARGYALVEIHSAPYTLEDTFIRLLEGQ